MNFLTKIAILASCMTLSACVLAENPEKQQGMTKAQAKKIQNPSEDLCDLYNWYGDGVCDTFCESPDPDCGVCEIAALCPSGYYEVEECSSPGLCLEMNSCAGTLICEPEIYCLGLDAAEGDAIAPQETCGPDYQLVDFCEEDGSTCYTIGGFCGGSVQYCELMVNCLAYPSCPAGTTQVDACPPDMSCFEQTMCGSTILCAEDINCDAIPVCPDGTVEVQQCPQDTSCFEQRVCGTTILCAGDMYCDALFDEQFQSACPDGYSLVDSCPTDVDCYEETICGSTIACLRDQPVCLAIPVCPADKKMVEACDPAINTPCEEVTVCGTTITCQ
ncbi:MAG: hypothetical protein R3E66_12490 [bacterium]